MNRNFVPRFFTLYCKLLCDCFKTNFEPRMIHLKELVKWNWCRMKFYLCLHSFFKLWNLFSRVFFLENLFSEFRQLFISILSIKKMKKGLWNKYNFCPLYTENAGFLIGFCIDFPLDLLWNALVNTRNAWIFMTYLYVAIKNLLYEINSTKVWDSCVKLWLYSHWWTWRRPNTH